jgi:4-diphosphocytidyl-2-C-methyl-D-erythritol kinase
MMRLRAEPAAKVNLALAVTGRRADGYHKLRSVFLRTALHDDLEVEVDSAASGDSLEVEGDAVESGSDNLVLKAAANLRQIIGGPLPALRFKLTKRIPTAAGLGGGSSDGAAALDLAQAAWGVRLHPSARLEAALQLGADVPFFAAGHAASLVSGIGEGLQPLPAPDPPAGLLLITPAERLSTVAVFDDLDRAPAPDAAALERVEEMASLLRDKVDGMTLAAENVGQTNERHPGSAIFESWKRSPDHYRNLIGRPFNHTGIGVAKTPDGRTFVTQLYVTFPRP